MHTSQPPHQYLKERLLILTELYSLLLAAPKLLPKIIPPLDLLRQERLITACLRQLWK
jgi:hypothetical protein